MSAQSHSHSQNRTAIAALNGRLYQGDRAGFAKALHSLMAPDATLHLCCPFDDQTGPQALLDTVYTSLWSAFPDLEERVLIRAAGPAQQGGDWVGTLSNFIGTFTAPFLDIPPTGHLTHMRAHQFYRFQNGRIVEMQAIWDIPELMMQAGVWPMAPALAPLVMTPAPASQTGLITGPHDPLLAQSNCAHVVDMLTALVRHPAQGGPEVMEMERFWHPMFNWYGPACIGSMRGVPGFRHWHQIPFLSAMPDRGQDEAGLSMHFFGDGDTVAVTGWPDMRQTLSNDGWLGLVPTNTAIELRSLDFWRIEDTLIRENWVLLDMPDIYRQLGVDVFDRLRSANKARNMGPVNWPPADP